MVPEFPNRNQYPFRTHLPRRRAEWTFRSSVFTLTGMEISLDLTFWEWILAIIFVSFVGLVSGRILGVRRGFWRAAIAGILGTFVGLIIAAIVLQNVTPIDETALLIVTFGFGVLATMLISIVLEIVLRPRRIGRKGKLRTRIRSFFTVCGRLWEVSRIARRHGLAGPRLANRVRPSPARRRRADPRVPRGLRRRLHQVRSDRLHEKRSAAAGGDHRAVRICSPTCGRCPATRCATSWNPAWAGPSRRSSAASPTSRWPPRRSVRHISRELLDGTQVVVKVRRPDVAVSVARDSAVLRWATRIAVRRSEAARSLGTRRPLRRADQVGRAGAGLSQRGGERQGPGGGVRGVPGVDGALASSRSSARTPCWSWSGSTVAPCRTPRPSTPARCRGPSWPSGCCRRSWTTSCARGIFHADPHPGNILIDAEGTLWLIDFGAVGLIDPVTLESLQSMGAGLATGQPGLVARGLRTISGPAGDAVNPQALESEISRVLSEQLHSPGFDPAALQKVVDLMRRNGLPVPSTFTAARQGDGDGGRHPAGDRSEGRLRRPRRPHRSAARSSGRR